MTYILQTLADALTSPVLLQLSVAAGALLMAHCGRGRCGHNHIDEDDEEEEEEDDVDDDEDDDDYGDYIDYESDFNFTSEELREYNEMVEETDRRIEELVDLIEQDPENIQELQDELIRAYLSRAARQQEEGEDADAFEDYAAAFDIIDEYIDAYGESVEILKVIAAACLNYGILLNDCDRLDDADYEYELAAQANEKLVAFGDKDAKLDLLGIKLNRAALAFENGVHSDSFNMLDEVIGDFEQLAETEPTIKDNVLYYLAKALTVKSDFIRSTLEEGDVDSSEAAEAREASGRAVDVFRALVNAGHTDYKRDLAESLVSYVETSPQRSREDLVDAINALSEACGAYESVVAFGQTDAIVELFEATMKRADLLMQAEMPKEALALYDYVVESFEKFSDSNELPLLEWLAAAYQRCAQLRKGHVAPGKTIADLTKAIDLQMKIADDLIATLKELDEEHECEGCGCEHSESGRQREHCGCGSECGCAERKFLVEHWVNDNFHALTECLYERACAHLENQHSADAGNDCLTAAAVEKAYRLVLREDEKLNMEFARLLRDMQAVM